MDWIEPQPQTAGTTDHVCPYPGCTRTVSFVMLMCKRHWWQVPKEIRQRVWAEYRREPGSIEHVRAISDAIRSVQGKEDSNASSAES